MTERKEFEDEDSLKEEEEDDGFELDNSASNQSQTCKPPTVEIYYPGQTRRRKSKWTSLKNMVRVVHAFKPARPTQTTEQDLDALPESFRHLYTEPIMSPNRRPSFSLTHETQEEIFHICGEEVNLYLAGVNRRLSSAAAYRVEDDEEGPVY